MMQQINLYQAEFRPQVTLLTAWQMLLIAIAVILLMIFSSFMSSSDLKTQRDQLIIEQQTSNRLTQQSNDLKQDILKYNEQSMLTARLATLQNQLKQQQAILDHLQNDDLSPKKGFTESLKSLSEQHIEHVWLTSFAIQKGGQSIMLRGSCDRSELIPEYIDNLAKSPTFHGKQFSVFQMSAPDNNTDTYDFELQSQGNDSQ